MHIKLALNQQVLVCAIHMRPIFLLILLFTCCAAQKSSVKELLDMKKELSSAQLKLKKQQAYVERLEDDIARQEIACIQHELRQCEMSKPVLLDSEILAFFQQQRETLNRIICNHPSCRQDAQGVLDQILIFITQISDTLQ